MRANIAVLTLLAALTGCNENARVIPPREPENVIATRNTNDTLSFAVAATDFSFSRDQAISFSEPELYVRFTVSGYGGGQGIVEVRDSLWYVIRHDTLKSDTTLTAVRLTGLKPRYASILLENFTGNVSLSFQRDGPMPDFLSTGFPYRQGCRWTYTFDDPNFGFLDTMTTRALRDTLIGGHLGTYWYSSYSFHSVPESTHVVLSNDSLMMIERAPSKFGLSDVFFPLGFGDQWKTNRGYLDSSMVIAIEPVRVQAGFFPTTYVIDQRWTTPWGQSGRRISWLAPGVGIIRQVSSFGAIISSSSLTWELTEFSVP